MKRFRKQRLRFCELLPAEQTGTCVPKKVPALLRADRGVDLGELQREIDRLVNQVWSQVEAAG